MKKKFSVLTYNIGGYELLHDIPKEAMNPEAEYIYVTDDPSIESDTWEVLYVPHLKGSVFDKCYQIRFNPFDYVNTDIVMRIDGSMAIKSDVTPIIDAFTDGAYDAAVMIHPWRSTIVPEYSIWCSTRNYPTDQAVKCLNFMHNALCYDVYNYKGLYQGNFVIQRNNDFNKAWNLTTYDMLKHLTTEPDTIERLDQTIWSVVLNTLFSYKKIMPVDADILNGKYFKWCYHGRNDSFPVQNIIEPYMFNQKAETFK